MTKAAIDTAVDSLGSLPAHDWFYLISRAFDKFAENIATGGDLKPEMRLPAAIAVFMSVNAGACLVAMSQLDEELQVVPKAGRS